jgi:NPCBM-associated, NEW3 domain of alpha-galactosidase
MRTARFLGLGLICLLAAAPTAAAQRSTPGSGGFFERPLIEVSISREEVSTKLGQDFSFTSRIENIGTATRSGLIAHLNVVGLDTDIYVDPEDWSEERTKNVASLAPGESVEVTWDVTAVTGGEAAIYVVVLPGGSSATARDGLAVSSAMDVRIAEAKNLNTDGVLPLALGVPALLGLATLGVRRRRRR